MPAETFQREALKEEERRQWAKARDIQERFMRRPVRTTDTLDCSARCRQLHDLGGDCFDFLPLNGKNLAFAIGDASGKGFAAALMISNVQSSLRTAALLSGNDLAGTIEAVNRQVYASSLPDRYATLFYGAFDATRQTLQYVNAGHNPPMILRQDGSSDWLETGGAPLGMFGDWDFDKGAVSMSPGDLLIAYTDGVIEAMNPAGQEWGVEGLQKAVVECASQSAEDIVEAIFKSMDEFSQGRQTDDATVLVFRVCGGHKK
jgi:phosphoserine phosphatase RsbU/P